MRPRFTIFYQSVTLILFLDSTMSHLCVYTSNGYTAYEVCRVVSAHLVIAIASFLEKTLKQEV